MDNTGVGKTAQALRDTFTNLSSNCERCTATLTAKEKAEVSRQ